MFHQLFAPVTKLIAIASVNHIYFCVTKQSSSFVGFLYLEQFPLDQLNEQLSTLINTYLPSKIILSESLAYLYDDQRNALFFGIQVKFNYLTMESFDTAFLGQLQLNYRAGNIKFVSEEVKSHFKRKLLINTKEPDIGAIAILTAYDDSKQITLHGQTKPYGIFA